MHTHGHDCEHHDTHCCTHDKHVSHEHHEGHHDHSHHMKEYWNRFVVSLLLTIPIVVLSPTVQELLGYTLDIPFRDLIILILSTAVFFYGGQPFLKGAIEEIKNRSPGMMSLVSLAIIVAYVYSLLVYTGLPGKDFFYEMATLITVMLLGHYIEAKSVVSARSAVKEILSLIPETARKKDGKTVSVDDLTKGDVVVVSEGDRIPLDGRVVKGSLLVDESLITGESKPVEKGPGDEVVGGCLVLSGTAEIEIAVNPSDTYVRRLATLVEEIERQKTRTQSLANKAAAVLFYASLVSGITAFTFWSLFSIPFALERMISVFVVACPHALGLATPLVVAVSTSRSASKGIVFKNREALETLKDVRAVLFDKTGTLTKGKPEVINYTDEYTLRFAASVEKYSNHVLAKAIVDKAMENGLDISEEFEVTVVKGMGLKGKNENREVFVGSKSFMEENGIEVPDVGEGTAVYVAENGKYVGVIVLRDELKDGAKEAVRELKKMGIKVFVVSGDSKSEVERIAKELDVDGYYYEVKPEEKVKVVEELKQKMFVAFVGDGINDAPALKASNVGIAVGSGTKIAIESADVILVTDDIRKVPESIKISDVTYKKMLSNLVWAAGYNVLAIPAAAGVFYPFLITPAMAAIIMSLSTVIVVVNALMLKV